MLRFSFMAHLRRDGLRARGVPPTQIVAKFTKRRCCGRRPGPGGASLVVPSGTLSESDVRVSGPRAPLACQADLPRRVGIELGDPGAGIEDVTGRPFENTG